MKWLENLVMNDKFARIVASILIAIVVAAGIIQITAILTGHPLSEAEIMETRTKNLWLLFLQAFMIR